MRITRKQFIASLMALIGLKAVNGRENDQYGRPFWINARSGTIDQLYVADPYTYATATEIEDLRKEIHRAHIRTMDKIIIKAMNGQ